MSRYEVILAQDGMEYVTARTRRLAGAEREADAITEHTRKNLTTHAGPGERLVEGPTESGDYAVLRLAVDGTVAAYREVWIRQRCGRHRVRMQGICGEARCGLCYEETIGDLPVSRSSGTFGWIPTGHGHSRIGRISESAPLP